MGGSVSNFVEDTVSSVKNVAKDTYGSVKKGAKNLNLKNVGAFAANPLIAQDLEFSRLVGGGKVGASGEALSDPRGFIRNQKNQRDLITGNAILAGGAAGGAYGAAVAIPEVGFVAPGGVIASGLGGAALGAGAGKLTGDYTGQMVAPDPVALPDVGGIAVEAAGPVAADLAALARQRQRRGRAGTILTSGQTLGGTTGGKTLLGQ